MSCDWTLLLVADAAALMVVSLLVVVLYLRDLGRSRRRGR